MTERHERHLDPPNAEMIRRTEQLSPSMRIQRLLDARELTIGLIRGRLRRQFPDLTMHKLNLKVLEEIERAKRKNCPDRVSSWQYCALSKG